MKPEQAIDLFNIVSFIFSILLLLGVLQSETVVFQKISFIVKMIVGILLLYKFNDIYPQKQFTIIDRKVCFLAGTYVVAFTLGDALSNYSIKTSDKIKTILDSLNLLK
jgi:hypothetical protein